MHYTWSLKIIHIRLRDDDYQCVIITSASNIKQCDEIELNDLNLDKLEFSDPNGTKLKHND